MGAFLACLAEQPASHWDCNDGVAAIKPGYCESQQGNFAYCFESQLDQKL